MADKIELALYFNSAGFAKGIQEAINAWDRFEKNINPARLSQMKNPIQGATQSLTAFKAKLAESGIAGEPLKRIQELFKQITIEIETTGRVSRKTVLQLGNDFRKFQSEMSIGLNAPKTTGMAMPAMGAGMGASAAASTSILSKGLGIVMGAFGGVATAINYVRSKLLSWIATIAATVFMIQRLVADIKVYETELRNISILTGASKADMGEFRKEVERIATTYPMATEEIAKTAHVIADFGVSTQEMVPILEQATRLAVIFGENAGPIAKVIYSASSSFKELGGNAQKTAEIIYGATTSGILNLDQFSTAYNYLSGTAQSLGFTFKDLSLLITMSSEKMLKASMVGTGLREIMTEMVKAVSDYSGKTKEQQALLESLGLTQDKIKTAFAASSDEYGRAKGLIGLLSGVIQKAGTDMNAAGAFSELFGKRAQGLGLNLGKMNDLIKESIVAMEVNSGKLKEQKTGITDLSSSMQILQNVWLLLKDSFALGAESGFMGFGKSVINIFSNLKPILTLAGQEFGKIFTWVISFLQTVDWTPFIDALVSVWILIKQIGPMFMQWAVVILGVLAPAITILANLLTLVYKILEPIMIVLQYFFQGIADILGVSAKGWNSAMGSMDESAKKLLSTTGKLDLSHLFGSTGIGGPTMVPAMASASGGNVPINIGVENVNVRIDNLDSASRQIASQLTREISNEVKKQVPENVIATLDRNERNAEIRKSFSR